MAAAVDEGREGSVRRSAGALWRRSYDRVVVLPPHQPQPVLLAGTAVALWDVLAAPVTIGAAAAHLAALYDADVAAVAEDLASAVADLCARGVLETVSEP